MMPAIQKAVEQAEKEGTSCEVLDLRTLSPMDWDGVISSVKRTGRAVIVQEAPKTCGLAAEIAARIDEEALLSLKAPVERVTGSGYHPAVAEGRGLLLRECGEDRKGDQASDELLRVREMATDFKFPDLGEGVTEGEIKKWLVKEGDAVKQDQSIAEVETDKAVVEMPSPLAGKILKLYRQEGETVKVGEVLAIIGAEGEAYHGCTSGGHSGRRREAPIGLGGRRAAGERDVDLERAKRGRRRRAAPPSRPCHRCGSWPRT